MNLFICFFVIKKKNLNYTVSFLKGFSFFYFAASKVSSARVGTGEHNEEIDGMYHSEFSP